MRKYLLAVAVITFAFNAGAQLTQLTKKDYENAERFMSYNIDPFIDGGNVRPNWLPGDQFWYLVRRGSREQPVLEQRQRLIRERDEQAHRPVRRGAAY